MTIRTCSAVTILALCYSQLGAAPAAGALAALVRAWRESPTPAHRAAIATYVSGHPKETALANLAIGVGLYEQKNWSGAIAALKSAQGKLPEIADYNSFYLAAARVENEDYDVTSADLAAARRNSPLAAKSWLLEARARKQTAPAEAVRLIRDHYADLPQPEADFTLADCYQAANDLPHAAEFYQRVYYHYLTGAAATKSAAALLALKDALGDKYPAPSSTQLLHRADRLLDAREYAAARNEYQSVASQAKGAERELAEVGIGAADYLAGKASLASPYLRVLDVTSTEASAQRLYYLVECARRRDDDDEMTAMLKQLGARYKDSPWRLKALTSAANRYLLLNRPDDYVPLNRAVYQDFPSSPSAALSHWKVTFQAYLHDQPDAGRLLREHLTRYPGHSTAGAALYFLGRQLERAGDNLGARSSYLRLTLVFENHYYAMQARDRLKAIGSAPAGGEAGEWIAALKFPSPAKVANDATDATVSRIERSRLLRAAGLNDLADAELRFGMRTDGQPALLAMEMAESADAPHQAMRVMKSNNPDYLNLPVPAAPRKFWELLFPLPYRGDLVRSARERDLDPFLVAGLIRQESEFNPGAVSRAKAYGLTQVRPVTGRQFARIAGVTRVTTSVLSQPSANLKLGTSILKSMLDHQGGSIEQTLAAYNAGPNRVVEWMAWNTYREPAEFVESIPFTETRDYVQAVMRNAEMYRRLYQ